MHTVTVYSDAYQRLVAYYQQYVPSPRADDWDAVYSCNTHRESWPCPGFGFLPPENRVFVQARSKLLRELVDIVVADRPNEGGRFFINKEGVLVKPEYEEQRQIASFDWRTSRYG